MKKILLILFLAILSALMGCEEEPNVNPNGFTEFKVNINGSWKIERFTQNGIDITNALNSQSSEINLNYEGITPSTFSLSSKFPFVTKSLNGNWSFDDPVFPKTINFSDGTSVNILEPIRSSGENRIILGFNLGCSQTNYQYVLIK
jgi:hypothetical protein